MNPTKFGRVAQKQRSMIFYFTHGRIAIEYSRLHRFQKCKLRIQSQGEEHEKEEKTPERSERQFVDHFWVDFKCQTHSLIDYFGHLGIGDAGQIAYHRKYGKTGKNAGQNIGERHDQCVTVGRRRERRCQITCKMQIINICF